MRGLALQNSIKTAIPAHLWPLKMDENCDALPEQPTPSRSNSSFWPATPVNVHVHVKYHTPPSLLSSHQLGQAFAVLLVRLSFKAVFA
jgi:hypothetical protein